VGSAVPVAPSDADGEPLAQLTARLLQTAERLEQAALRLAPAAVAHFQTFAPRPFLGRIDG
jgi:hypothetical protein